MPELAWLWAPDWGKDRRARPFGPWIPVETRADENRLCFTREGPLGGNQSPLRVVSALDGEERVSLSPAANLRPRAASDELVRLCCGAEGPPAGTTSRPDAQALLQACSGCLGRSGGVCDADVYVLARIFDTVSYKLDDTRHLEVRFERGDARRDLTVDFGDLQLHVSDDPERQLAEGGLWGGGEGAAKAAAVGVCGADGAVGAVSTLGSSNASRVAALFARAAANPRLHFCVHAPSSRVFFRPSAEDGGWSTVEPFPLPAGEGGGPLLAEEARAAPPPLRALASALAEFPFTPPELCVSARPGARGRRSARGGHRLAPAHVFLPRALLRAALQTAFSLSVLCPGKRAWGLRLDVEEFLERREELAHFSRDRGTGSGFPVPLPAMPWLPDQSPHELWMDMSDVSLTLSVTESPALSERRVPSARRGEGGKGGRRDGQRERQREGRILLGRASDSASDSLEVRGRVGLGLSVASGPADASGETGATDSESSASSEEGGFGGGTKRAVGLGAPRAPGGPGAQGPGAPGSGAPTAGSSGSSSSSGTTGDAGDAAGSPAFGANGSPSDSEAALRVTPVRTRAPGSLPLAGAELPALSMILRQSSVLRPFEDGHGPPCCPDRNPSPFGVSCAGPAPAPGSPPVQMSPALLRLQAVPNLVSAMSGASILSPRYAELVTGGVLAPLALLAGQGKGAAGSGGAGRRAASGDAGTGPFRVLSRSPGEAPPGPSTDSPASLATNPPANPQMDSAKGSSMPRTGTSTHPAASWAASSGSALWKRLARQEESGTPPAAGEGQRPMSRTAPAAPSRNSGSETPKLPGRPGSAATAPAGLQVARPPPPRTSYHIPNALLRVDESWVRPSPSAF